MTRINLSSSCKKDAAQRVADVRGMASGRQTTPPRPGQPPVSRARLCLFVLSVCASALFEAHFGAASRGLLFCVLAFALLSILLYVCFFHSRSLHLRGIARDASAALFSLGLAVALRAAGKIHYGDIYNEGVEANYMDPFSAADLFVCLLAAAVFYFCIVACVFLLRERGAKAATLFVGERPWGKFSTGRAFLLCWLPILAVCVVFLLAEYPGGLFFNDIVGMFEDDIAASPSPALFNCLGRLFLWIGTCAGSANLGLFLVNLCQCLLASAIYAFLLAWLREKGARPWLLVATFAFFCFSPLVIDYAITFIKDTWFTFGMLLAVPLLWDAACEKGCWAKKAMRYPRLPLFCAAIVLLCASRSNGLPAAVIFVVLAVVFSGRARRRVLAIAGTAAVVLVFGCSSILTASGGVSTTSFRESVGIPLQQIAAVVSEDGQISAEEQGVVYALLSQEDWKKKYRPCEVDSLKYDANFNCTYLNTHRTEFLRAWIGIGLKNPRLYLRAYVMTTFGFWVPGVSSDTQQAFLPEYEHKENSIGFGRGHLTCKELTQAADAYLRQAIDAPGEAGTLLWLYAGLALLLFCTRQGRKAAVFAPMGVYWLTLLVALPIAFAFRYVFFALVLLPAFIVLFACSFAMPACNSAYEFSAHNVKTPVPRK